MEHKQKNEKGVEILIAEDSPTQAMQLCLLLEGHGYTVTSVTDGRQALLAARHRRPDLIVSDVVMPELDGYALCRAIRADDGLRDVPVVLLTSLVSAEDVVKGLECGADNFIRKSCDERYLLSRIEAILLDRAMRGERKVQMGVEIHLAGRKHIITAERQQILDLLISTYEEAIHVNAQLEAVNKELEAFSYSVSHDLRAPLRRMDGFGEALIQEFGDALGDKGRDYLERLRATGRQMAELIDDLLRLSHVARTEMHYERVDLSALAREVAEDLARSQPDRPVDFVIAEGLLAQGDGRLLRVVLENLLGNAWKFTRDCPRARIELGRAARADGDDVYMVRDNGAGFDMTYVHKLFAPFQRLHSEREFPGTGIGLATVQRILHRHGGGIWAEAEVGKGAAFYFTL